MSQLALFDLDRTILKIDSALSWMKFQRRRGLASRRMLAKAIGWSALYKLNLLDMDRLATALTLDLRGQPEPRMRTLACEWFAGDIAHQVSPRARAAIERHREHGDIIVLATGSSQYAAEPAAALLGIDHIVCTRIESQDGVFTGRLAAKGYGHYKVAQAQQLATRLGRSLAQATFYSDSFNDAPLLLAVKHPVAVNPDRALRKHAARAGWRTEAWA